MRGSNAILEMGARAQQHLIQSRKRGVLKWQDRSILGRGATTSTTTKRASKLKKTVLFRTIGASSEKLPKNLFLPSFLIVPLYSFPNLPSRSPGRESSLLLPTAISSRPLPNCYPTGGGIHRHLTDDLTKGRFNFGIFSV